MHITTNPCRRTRKPACHSTSRIRAHHIRRCRPPTFTLQPLSNCNHNAKMYARLPSFDSRLETDNIRFAIVFNSICSYADTIPLLSDPAPEPMLPPTKRREPTIRWAPLPVSPSSSSSKGKPVRSWARQSVREPAPPSMVKKGSREPVLRSAPGGWRKYAPSETVARVRKWCKKHADVDREQDPIMTEAGSKGRFRFCDGREKMLGSLSAARGGMVW